MFEQLLEELAFDAFDSGDANQPMYTQVIDEAYVRHHLSGENQPADMRRYIL